MYVFGLFYLELFLVINIYMCELVFIYIYNELEVSISYLYIEG